VKAAGIVPSHLPSRLAITLRDFCWYVRTGPGEPFADIDATFRRARELGYNAVRICAMPFLLFRSGLDTTALRLEPTGTSTGTWCSSWYSWYSWYAGPAGPSLAVRLRRVAADQLGGEDDPGGWLAVDQVEQ
jgi:hypothetical protein